MDVRDKIIEFIRTRGPILPAQVAKEINTNILMASAYLSELASQNKVRISHLKVGSSPLYFLLGQEIKLQSFTNNLADIEQRSVEKLRTNKVLRDAILDPGTRLALKNTKDFAIPLQVNYQGNSEIFWKFYLIDDKEAEPLIKSLLMPQQQKIEEQKAIEKQTIVEEKTEKTIEQIEKKEKIEKQKTLKPIEKPKKIKKTAEKTDNKIENYFSKNKIEIIEPLIKEETDYVISLSTNIGKLIYYCRYKDKPKITENDINALFISAQSMKLPAMMLYTGEIAKKAKELLEKEFKGIVIVKI